MFHVRRFLCTAAVMALLTFTLAAEPQAEPASVSRPAGDAPSAAADLFPEKVSVDYSTAFDVAYHGTYKVVTVSKPWPGAASGLTYLLVQRGTRAPEGVTADRVFEIPVETVVTMSTSYLPCLEALGVLDTLIGHETFAWIYSPAVGKRIADGKMKEVGSGQNVNVELLLDMDPDLIMAYGIGNEWDTHPKLDEARLPYVINAEWNETTPLGRAEWIKYIALFYNKEAVANEFFDTVVEEYTAYSLAASAASQKPTVFAGTPYQGTWWMSGGGSFAARLFADAGADYLWADDDSTGSLMLDVEAVFEKAAEADFWVNTGYWSTLGEVAAADNRFAEFKPYQTGRMYNNNRRMSSGGGNDYYESAPINPNRVLADLIEIFHPGLLPGHQLYYYRKLE